MSLVLSVVLALTPTITPAEERAEACEAARRDLAAMFPVAHDDLDQLKEALVVWRNCFAPPPEPVDSHEDAPDEPVTTSTPDAPSRRGMGSDVEQWRGLVTAYFGGAKADTALCLMAHESGGNPNAKNPRSSASGLFQLLATWHDYFGIDPFNPEQNIAAAAQLQAMYGWSQWSPYNRGECR